jgi:hypothetical protein
MYPRRGVPSSLSFRSLILRSAVERRGMKRAGLAAAVVGRHGYFLGGCNRTSRLCGRPAREGGSPPAVGERHGRVAA